MEVTQQKIALASLLIFINTFVCAQQPVEYLQQISAEYEKVNKETMSYISAVSHGKSARKVEKRRTDLVKQIMQAEFNVRKMKGFAGNSTLRDSVVAYFDLSEKVLNTRYSEIMNLEAIAEQSYDNMELYLNAKNKAEEILEQAADRVDSLVKVFADENKIRLVSGNSEVQKKLARASKVNEYYNKLYLLFFKCLKDEAYFLDAVKKQSTVEQLQFAEQLGINAKENLEKIGPITPFAGDATLKTACRQALEFFAQEAATSNLFTDFALQKEKFEKIKESIEKKNPQQRTQTDIDTYNKAVAEYNKALNQFNTAQEKLFKTRNEVLSKWENTSNAFLNKHVPRY
ncbi:MAG: hypothetical protein ACK5WV_14040 [Chryseotalea sp.]|jgi:hypothetical protein